MASTPSLPGAHPECETPLLARDGSSSALRPQSTTNPHVTRTTRDERGETSLSEPPVRRHAHHSSIEKQCDECELRRPQVVLVFTVDGLYSRTEPVVVFYQCQQKSVSAYIQRLVSSSTAVRGSCRSSSAVFSTSANSERSAASGSSAIGINLIPSCSWTILVTVPDEDSDGEYEKTGEWEGHDVVRWAGDEESYEYWECDDCYCFPDQ
jgi:hypothetical protein